MYFNSQEQNRKDLIFCRHKEKIRTILCKLCFVPQKFQVGLFLRLLCECIKQTLLRRFVQHVTLESVTQK